MKWRQICAFCCLIVLLLSGCKTIETAAAPELATTARPTSAPEVAPTAAPTSAPPDNEAGTPPIVGAIDEQDQELVERSVLAITDLPSDWREAPPNENDASEIYDSIEACDGVQKIANAGNESGLSDAVHFERGNNTRIEALVGVWTAPDDAMNTMDEWSSDATADCLEQGIPLALDAAGMPSDLGITALEVGRLAVDPVGDGRLGWQIQITFADGQSEVDLFLEVQYVRVGRALAVLETTSLFSPVRERETFMATMVARLEAEPGL